MLELHIYICQEFTLMLMVEVFYRGGDVKLHISMVSRKAKRWIYRVGVCNVIYKITQESALAYQFVGLTRPLLLLMSIRWELKPVFF